MFSDVCLCGFAGGISTVSFNATGDHCLTAGLDGAVLLHTVQDPSKAHLSQLPLQSPGLTELPDSDAMDDDSEATQVAGLLTISGSDTVHSIAMRYLKRQQHAEQQSVVSSLQLCI